jgi:hypothetical protein
MLHVLPRAFAVAGAPAFAATGALPQTHARSGAFAHTAPAAAMPQVHQRHGQLPRAKLAVVVLVEALDDPLRNVQRPRALPLAATAIGRFRTGRSTATSELAFAVASGPPGSPPARRAAGLAAIILPGLAVFLIVKPPRGPPPDCRARIAALVFAEPSVAVRVE